MRKVIIAAFTAIMLMALTTIATAAVVYDPDTGGYAGKGDVQNALGLKNNAALQAVAGDVVFRYSDTVITEGGACLNPNTNAPHPNDVWERTSGVSATLDFSAKNVKQFSGWRLDPADTAGGAVYSDECGGNRIEGVGTVIDTQPGAGLEVSLDGTNWVSLPNAP